MKVNLVKQLDPKVIDGRIYVDLDALLDVLFKSCELSAQKASEAQDIPLGVMVTGQTVLVQALDDALGAFQAEHGLEVTGTPQRPAEGHTEA